MPYKNLIEWPLFWLHKTFRDLAIINHQMLLGSRISIFYQAIEFPFPEFHYFLFSYCPKYPGKSFKKYLNDNLYVDHSQILNSTSFLRTLCFNHLLDLPTQMFYRPLKHNTPKLNFLSQVTTSPVIPFFCKFHPLSYSLYFLFFTAKYFPKILLWVYHLNISNPIFCLLPFQKKKNKRNKQTTAATEKSKHNTKQRCP